MVIRQISKRLTSLAMKVFETSPGGTQGAFLAMKSGFLFLLSQFTFPS